MGGGAIPPPEIFGSLPGGNDINRFPHTEKGSGNARTVRVIPKTTRIEIETYRPCKDRDDAELLPNFRKHREMGVSIFFSF